MYIGDEIANLVPLLHGIRLTCGLFGFHQSSSIRKKLVNESGREYIPSHELCSQLIENGHDYRFIVEEVLSLEIALWNKSVNQHNVKVD
jgi:hypothetical protein